MTPTALTVAKSLALSAFPALTLAPCLSSLPLATLGGAALVAGWMLWSLEARRQMDAEAEYLMRLEVLAAYAEPIDYPECF